MQNWRWLLRGITAVHRAIYRASGGRLGAWLTAPMLLLTTRGRRSGAPRTVPLLYVPDGERFVVVGSNAGDDRPPAWWLNLEAEPRASIQVGPDRHDVVARRAVGEERARLWSLLVSTHAGYREYERRTSREIPIVILEIA